MAVVALTPLKIDRTGPAPTRTALSIANTYTVRNDGRVVLHFLKTGAGAAVITVTTPATPGGLALADLTKTVPATTGDVFLGPFPPALFNDPSGDLVFATDEDTGITAVALRIP